MEFTRAVGDKRMNERQVEVNPQRHAQIRRQTRQTARILLAVFLVGLSLHVAYRVVLGLRIATVLGEMRVAGYPTDDETFLRWRRQTPPPGSPEALFSEACEAAAGTVNNRAALPLDAMSVVLLYDLGSNPAVDAWVKDRLAADRRALNILYAALALRESRGPAHLTGGPFLQTRKGCDRIAWLVLVDAVDHFRDGRTDQTVACVNAAFRMAHWYREQPLLDSQWSGNSLLSESLGVLQRLLSDAKWTDAQLAHWSGKLMDLHNPRGVGHGLVDLALVDVQRVTDIIWNGERLWPDGLCSSWEWCWRPAGQEDALRGLHLARTWRIIQATGSPLPGRAESIRRVLRETGKDPLSGRGIDCYVSVRSVVEVALCHESRLRAAEVALAVERYRLDTGRLPTALSDLTPRYIGGLPEDPFDGQPLRSRAKEGTYVIYSVGPNLKDDIGAAAGANWGQWRCDDQFFLVGRVVRKDAEQNPMRFSAPPDGPWPELE